MAADDGQVWVAAAEGVVQVHGTPAGHHEDVADAVSGQGLRKIIRDSDHKKYVERI
jgi:hypothetical protein